MNFNEVRKLVDMAIADLSTKGVEHAWEKYVDGNLVVLKWVDIRDALESLVGTLETTEDPVNSARKFLGVEEHESVLSNVYQGLGISPDPANQNSISDVSLLGGDRHGTV